MEIFYSLNLFQPTLNLPENLAPASNASGYTQQDRNHQEQKEI